MNSLHSNFHIAMKMLLRYGENSCWETIFYTFSWIDNSNADNVINTGKEMIISSCVLKECIFIFVIIV